MSDAPWDVIVVGQGLAGTTLAWHLILAGQRVLIVDREDAITSSKIAAGLITPITGMRLALSWRGDEFLNVARTFYRLIEARTGQTFFHERTAVRLFKSEAEREQWARRLLQPGVQDCLERPQPPTVLDADIADSRGGGFQMRAAQLDVAAYLDASRQAVPYAPMTLDWARDVSIGDDGIGVQDQRARTVIACEGFAATRNPYFSWVPFQAAKGDILTVRFQRPLPPQCLHRGIWVAPTREPDVFRVGSTYDRVTLDQIPNRLARHELERELAAFLRIPFTVLDHQAAVRPIIQESKALIGLHPAHARLGFFNGLGSKGSLHAPWFAQCLTAFLVHGTPIPEGHDVGRIT
jgi:glycine oxidase